MRHSVHAGRELEHAAAKVRVSLPQELPEPLRLLLDLRADGRDLAPLLDVLICDRATSPSLCELRSTQQDQEGTGLAGTAEDVHDPKTKSVCCLLDSDVELVVQHESQPLRLVFLGHLLVAAARHELYLR